MGKNKKDKKDKQKKDVKSTSTEELKQEPQKQEEMPEIPTEPSDQFEKKAITENIEGTKYIWDEPWANLEEEIKWLQDDQEQQEKVEVKRLTKQFYSKLKENDKYLSDPKVSQDKKISMLYEKAVKSVKDLGALRK